MLTYPDSWIDIYTRLRSAGFRPDYVYDIGASDGLWSRTLADVFPHSIFYLFEPLGDHVASYREALGQLPPARFRVHHSALGETCGSVTIALTPDPRGSTSLEIVSGPSQIFPEAVDAPQQRLDRLLKAGIVKPAQLIKLDVQGGERRILRGAEYALKFAQVLQVECWLYASYGPETAMLADLVKLLGDCGFIAIEFSDPWYAAENHQLCCLDLYFAREDLAPNFASTLAAPPAGRSA
jgi:FkbM family methyltransferase